LSLCAGTRLPAPRAPCILYASISGNGGQVSGNGGQVGGNGGQGTLSMKTKDFLSANGGFSASSAVTYYTEMMITA